MLGKFRLVGLSKPASATLELLHTDKEIFWASCSHFEKGKFNEMFEYCKGDWGENKMAEVEYDYLDKDGVPVNARLLSIEALTI